MKTLNWDKYRRIQINIEKAQQNQIVSENLEEHYSFLHTELVIKEEDEDIFNDTFLKLTYNFNPEDSFTDQFRHYFHLLKGAYQRDSKAKPFISLSEDKVAE